VSRNISNNNKGGLMSCKPEVLYDEEYVLNRKQPYGIKVTVEIGHHVKIDDNRTPIKVAYSDSWLAVIEEGSLTQKQFKIIMKEIYDYLKPQEEIPTKNKSNKMSKSQKRHMRKANK
jgi:hypothetical protein